MQRAAPPKKGPRVTGPPKLELRSASIQTYLLARSRVVHVPAEERNYHAFYLLFHLPEGEKTKLGIEGLAPKHFKFLGEGDIGPVTIAGQTDAELLKDPR